jgi:Tol biopolymer transport system component
VLVQEDPLGEAGSRIVLRPPDGQVEVITRDFFAATDPCVSFEGTHLLFAARRSSDDSWDIWQMRADGSEPRRLTSDLGECREPIYLPRAAVDSPNFEHRVRWITFTATAAGVLDDQGAAPLTSLWAMSIEDVPGRGTVLWRTTQNLGGDLAPALLSDGRVLFSSRQRGAFALMAMSWAGENLNPFYGSHDGLVSQVGAVEAPDRTVVFVEAAAASRDAGGRLARVTLRRPLHSHEVLAEDGRYRTPHALPDGRLLVAHSSGSDTYGIRLFDPARGRLGKVVLDDPEWDDVDAMPLVPREEPAARIPTVEFASVLDVGTLRGVGQLQCLDVYESDRPEAQVDPGSVRSVRFVEGVPVPLDGAPSFTTDAPDTTWPPRGVSTRTLGEVPVEEDGSFYVNVAADVPFYLETLDAKGEVLQTMRAWMSVRAGDQRGCVGCHEDKELAPENRATMALIRADPPTLLRPDSAEETR